MAAFGGWLATIARNRAHDYHRQWEDHAGLPEHAAESVAGKRSSTIEAVAILAAIRSLPETYRETLILRLVEGMTGPEIAARTGLQPRRADFALWFLLERRAAARGNLRQPRRAEYEELARVHTPELLDSLGQAETLARIFSLDPSDVPVDEVMSSVRLACGATIGAAREVLSGLNPRAVARRALNLMGGFHHARPDVAGGFCPVNDVAVAVAAVRADGFAGRVLVLDLDAHPHAPASPGDAAPRPFAGRHSAPRARTARRVKRPCAKRRPAGLVLSEGR